MSNIRKKIESLDLPFKIDIDNASNKVSDLTEKLRNIDLKEDAEGLEKVDQMLNPFVKIVEGSGVNMTASTWAEKFKKYPNIGKLTDFIEKYKTEDVSGGEPNDGEFFLYGFLASAGLFILLGLIAHFIKKRNARRARRLRNNVRRIINSEMEGQIQYLNGVQTGLNNLLIENPENFRPHVDIIIFINGKINEAKDMDQNIAGNYVSILNIIEEVREKLSELAEKFEIDSLIYNQIKKLQYMTARESLNLTIPGALPRDIIEAINNLRDPPLDGIQPLIGSILRGGAIGGYFLRIVLIIIIVILLIVLCYQMYCSWDATQKINYYCRKNHFHHHC